MIFLAMKILLIPSKKPKTNAIQDLKKFNLQLTDEERKLECMLELKKKLR